MNKQILMTTGVVLGMVVVIILFVVIITSFSGKNKPTDAESQISSSDMSGHHGSDVANDEQFQSLVGKVAPDFTLESYDQGQVNLQNESKVKLN